MFCSDVKWLEEDRFLSVRDALLKKGAGLELYIKDHEHNFVKELKIYGAKVHVVKQNLRSVHRFSILLSDGFESIIIRNKEYETENIQIDEYKNNPALVNLARDMLDDCIIQREDI